MDNKKVSEGMLINKPGRDSTNLKCETSNQFEGGTVLEKFADTALGQDYNDGEDSMVSLNTK